MSGEEFLLRLKLSNRVTTASKPELKDFKLARNLNGSYTEDCNYRENWIHQRCTPLHSVLGQLGTSPNWSQFRYYQESRCF